MTFLLGKSFKIFKVLHAHIPRIVDEYRSYTAFASLWETYIEQIVLGVLMMNSDEKFEDNTISLRTITLAVSRLQVKLQHLNESLRVVSIPMTLRTLLEGLLALRAR